MSETERPTVVAGNWKMHSGPGETRAFFGNLVLPDAPPVVILFPPAVSLLAAADAPDRDGRVALGVQNIHHADHGAFTGETSAAMAAEAGAAYALIGHSERRHVFGETDREVALKVTAAVRHRLTPVVCVGETLDQRRDGRVDEVIVGQLAAALEGLPDVESATFLVAYEPVWAIGTGETATPGDASAAHAALRGRLRAAGADPGTPLLYGGSVKPENASELMAAPDVDGVLVGGASLDPRAFSRIVAAGVRD